MTWEQATIWRQTHQRSTTTLHQHLKTYFFSQSKLMQRIYFSAAELYTHLASALHRPDLLNINYRTSGVTSSSSLPINCCPGGGGGPKPARKPKPTATKRGRSSSDDEDNKPQKKRTSSKTEQSGDPTSSESDDDEDYEEAEEETESADGDDDDDEDGDADVDDNDDDEQDNQPSPPRTRPKPTWKPRPQMASKSKKHVQDLLDMTTLDTLGDLSTEIQGLGRKAKTHSVLPSRQPAPKGRRRLYQTRKEKQAARPGQLDDQLKGKFGNNLAKIRLSFRNATKTV